MPKSANAKKKYQVADALTKQEIETELALTNPGSVYADLCRKALGRPTLKALSATVYGARLKIARRMIDNRRAK